METSILIYIVKKIMLNFIAYYVKKRNIFRL